MMIRPRWLARLLAWYGGYFWLPCPICGEDFAGFEWGEESLQRTFSTGEGLCSKPECVAEAKRRNALFWAAGEGCTERAEPRTWPDQEYQELVRKTEKLRNLLEEAVEEYLDFYHDAGPTSGAGWQSQPLKDFIKKCEAANGLNR